MNRYEYSICVADFPDIPLPEYHWNYNGEVYGCIVDDEYVLQLDDAVDRGVAGVMGGTIIERIYHNRVLIHKRSYPVENGWGGRMEEYYSVLQHKFEKITGYE